MKSLTADEIDVGPPAEGRVGANGSTPPNDAGPRSAGRAELPAELLIAEARQRHRRRQRRGAVALVSAALVAGGIALVGVGSPSPGPGAVVAPGAVAHGAAAQFKPTGPDVVSDASWGAPGLLSGVDCLGATCIAVGVSNQPTEPKLTAVGQARALVSVDSGATWTPGAVPSTVGELSAVQCPELAECLAVGSERAAGRATTRGAVVRSDDGGRRWSAPSRLPSTAPLDSVSCVSVAECVAVGSIPVGNQDFPVYGPAPSGVTMVRTTDGGRRWTSVAVPGSPIAIEAVSCDTDGFCMAVGSRYVRLAIGAVAMALVSTDGGASWRSVAGPSPIGPSGHAEALYPGTVNCFVAEQCMVSGPYYDGTNQASAALTSDGGVTWQPSSGFTMNEAFAPVAVNCANQLFCAAVGSVTMTGHGYDEVSTDGGATWSTPTALVGSGPKDEEFGSVNALSCSSPADCVAVGQGPGNWMFAATSRDSGGAWPLADSVPGPDGEVTSLACPTSLDCLAVSSGELIESVDGGARWHPAPLPVSLAGDVSVVKCFSDDGCVAAGVRLRALGQVGPIVVAVTGDRGSTWKVESVTRASADSVFLSCTAARTCVLTNGSDATSRGEAPLSMVSVDGGGHWRPITRPGGAGGFGGVTCMPAGPCLALSADANAVDLLELGDSSRAPRWHLVGQATAPPSSLTGDLTSIVGDGGGRLLGNEVVSSLACTSPQRCWALGTDNAPYDGVNVGFGRDEPPDAAMAGAIYSTDDGGRRWAVQALGSGQLEGLSCPAAGQCLAVGQGPAAGPDVVSQGVIWSDSGSGLTEVGAPRGATSLLAITCPTARRCVVGGSTSGAGTILTSADGGATWRASNLPAWRNSPLTVDSPTAG